MLRSSQSVRFTHKQQDLVTPTFFKCLSLYEEAGRNHKLNYTV